MRKRKIMLVLLLVGVFLSGCAGGSGGSFSPETSSIYVSKAGEFSSSLVEVYEKDYYNEDKLKVFIEEAVIAYNTEQGAEAVAVNSDKSTRLPVALKSCKLVNGTAEVIFDYADGVHLAAFTKENGDETQQIEEIRTGLFTPDEVADILFVTAESGAEITVVEIDSDKNLRLVTVTGAATLQTEGKLLYVSEGVTLTDSNTASTPEGTSYLIFK